MRKLVFGLILALGVSLFPAGAHADTVNDEASFVAKINDLRISKGLPALEVNANLVAKARGWAAGMAAAGRIWHSTLSDGITVDWQKLGENVGMGGSVDGLHAAFVASPHHYENLVDPDFGYVGIGIAMSSSGTMFVSEMFMKLMPAKVSVTLPPVTAPRVTTTSAPVTTSTSAPKLPAPRPVPRPVPPAPTPVVAVQAPGPPPPPPAAPGRRHPAPGAAGRPRSDPGRPGRPAPGPVRPARVGAGAPPQLRLVDPAARGRAPPRCNFPDMSVRVFVVDDTAHVRKMLVQMLELSGFDIVGQAASGTEAVDSIVDADPQVVVVDYKMPGLDGIETAREIRAHRPDQAIILYTAYLDDMLQKEAAAAGVSLCVGKIEGLTTLERDIRRLAGELF